MLWLKRGLVLLILALLSNNVFAVCNIYDREGKIVSDDVLRQRARAFIDNEYPDLSNDEIDYIIQEYLNEISEKQVPQTEPKPPLPRIAPMPMLSILPTLGLLWDGVKGLWNRFRIDGLIKDLDQNLDKHKREAARESLVRIGKPAVPKLLQTIKQKPWLYHGFDVLVEIGEPAVPGLIELLEDKNTLIKYDAIKSLGLIKSKKAVGSLANTLNDENPDIRIITINTLKDIGGDDAIDLLIKATESSDAVTRLYAVKALRSFKNDRVVSVLIELLEKDADFGVRLNVAKALSGMGNAKADDIIKNIFNDVALGVREEGSEIVLSKDWKSYVGIIPGLTVEHEQMYQTGAKAMSDFKGNYIIREMEGFETIRTQSKLTPEQYSAFLAWQEINGYEEKTTEETILIFDRLESLLREKSIKLTVGSLDADRLRKELEAGNYNQYAGAFNDMLKILLLIPDSLFKNGNLKEIVIFGERIEAARISGYDKDKGLISLYGILFDRSRRSFISTFVHELGHALAENNNLLLSDPKRKDKLKAAIKFTIKEAPDEMIYLSDAMGRSGDIKYQLGYITGFDEFMAENFMYYMFQGKQLRQHMDNVHGVIFQAYERVYHYYTKLFEGREFGKEFGKAKEISSPYSEEENCSACEWRNVKRRTGLEIGPLVDELRLFAEREFEVWVEELGLKKHITLIIDDSYYDDSDVLVFEIKFFDSENNEKFEVPENLLKVFENRVEEEVLYNFKDRISDLLLREKEEAGQKAIELIRIYRAKALINNLASLKLLNDVKDFYGVKYLDLKENWEVFVFEDFSQNKIGDDEFNKAVEEINNLFLDLDILFNRFKGYDQAKRTKHEHEIKVKLGNVIFSSQTFYKKLELIRKIYRDYDELVPKKVDNYLGTNEKLISDNYKKARKKYIAIEEHIDNLEEDIKDAKNYQKKLHEIITHGYYKRFRHARLTENLRLMYYLKDGKIVLYDIITHNDLDKSYRLEPLIKDI